MATAARPSAPSQPGSDARAELARAHGVDTVRDSPDGPVPVPTDTLVAVLAALGADASTEAAARAALDRYRQAEAARLLPHCLVTRTGRGIDLAADHGVPTAAEVWVELEGVPSGGPVRGVYGGWLPGDLPVGRHTLCARTRDHASAAPLIVAPSRVPYPERRGWGFLAQLYSVLSQRSWGMGDLGDLTELAQWAGHAHGADFVQVNPLHAGRPARAAIRPTPRRTARPRAASPTRCTCGSRPSRSSPTSTRPPASRSSGWPGAARRCGTRCCCTTA